MGRAQRVVRDLFEAYMDDPGAAAAELARGVLAPMTAAALPRQVCRLHRRHDRPLCALEQHKRLFDLDPLFR